MTVNAGPGDAPRPAAVRGNDWRAVVLPRPFAPTLPLSVVVPCRAAPGPLTLTLAALEGQSYPRNLFEVVVVDDGSTPPLAIGSNRPFPVRLVRREPSGFGLAAARNAGAGAAAHDILVFLDSDVIPAAGLLAAHARWHHAVSDALTLGLCAYVSTARLDEATIRSPGEGGLPRLLANRAADPLWQQRHLVRTGDFTSTHDDMFRAVAGGNLAIRRAFFEEVGGFDESFTRYGGEDTEFGYRIWCRGGLLVPVREAFGWHQGRWAQGREPKERDLDQQGEKLAHLIPDPSFRRIGRGPVFAVPRHVATIAAGDAPPERLLETVGALLADPWDDLAVRVEIPADRQDLHRRLETLLDPDPRLTITPAGTALEDFPHSPFHLSLSGGAIPPPGLVPKLRARLGDAATATAELADGSKATIARARFLHRAHRAGGIAADYGDSRSIRLPRFASSRSRAAAPRTRQRRGALAALDRVWDEARRVRGPVSAWRFVAWLALSLHWALRQTHVAVRRGCAGP